MGSIGAGRHATDLAPMTSDWTGRPSTTAVAHPGRALFDSLLEDPGILCWECVGALVGRGWQEDVETHMSRTGARRRGFRPLEADRLCIRFAPFGWPHRQSRDSIGKEGVGGVRRPLAASSLASGRAATGSTRRPRDCSALGFRVLFGSVRRFRCVFMQCVCISRCMSVCVCINGCSAFSATSRRAYVDGHPMKHCQNRASELLRLIPPLWEGKVPVDLVGSTTSTSDVAVGQSGLPSKLCCITDGCDNMGCNRTLVGREPGQENPLLQHKSASARPPHQSAHRDSCKAALQCCMEEELANSEALRSLDRERREGTSAEVLSLHAAESVQGVRVRLLRWAPERDCHLLGSVRLIAAELEASEGGAAALWDAVRRYKQRIASVCMFWGYI